MRSSHFLFTAFLLFVTSLASSQQPKDLPHTLVSSPPQKISQRALSIKELVDQVARTAPILRTDSADILIREAQARETRYKWLPNLNVNYQADLGTNNNLAGPYISYGLIPSNSRGVRPVSTQAAATTTIAAAALDWEIYNFGAYGAQNKVANSDIKIGSSRYGYSKYQIESYAAYTYLRLIQLQEELSIQLRNIVRNEDVKRSVKALAISGIRPGVDTSIAEAELSKARLNYIELLDQKKQVQLQLSSLSGLPPESLVADTLMTQKLLTLTASISAIPADSVNHPLLNYYQSIYEGNLDREFLVKRSYNPKVLLEGALWSRGSSINAMDQFNSLSEGFAFTRTNYLVGLAISYNLFDLGRRHLRLSTQKAITNYSLKSLQEQKAFLSLSSQEANAEMTTAFERLQEIPHQLNAASAGYRQKLSLYKSGLTDIIDLSAALNILYRAETDNIRARYSFSRAVFQKSVAGNDLLTLINLLN